MEPFEEGAAFLLGQRDFKRLFAYSSVENMGILAVGVGLGGAATYIEVATQSDYGASPLNYDARYSVLEAGLALFNAEGVANVPFT